MQANHCGWKTNQRTDPGSAFSSHFTLSPVQQQQKRKKAASETAAANGRAFPIPHYPAGNRIECIIPQNLPVVTVLEPALPFLYCPPLRKDPFFDMMEKMAGQNQTPACKRFCIAKADCRSSSCPPQRALSKKPKSKQRGKLPDENKNWNCFHPKDCGPGAAGGVADRAFREVCRALGAAYTIGEMTSSKGLIYQNKKTADLLTLGPSEHPGGIQLFGDDPLTMARRRRDVNGP